MIIIINSNNNTNSRSSNSNSSNDDDNNNDTKNDNDNSSSNNNGQHESGGASLATVLERIDRLEKLQEKAASKADLDALQRVAQQAAQQDFQRRNTMIWEVPIRKWFAKGCPQGSQYMSSEATLGDGVKAFFSFYPAGIDPHDVDAQGHKCASLYVDCPLHGDAEVIILTGSGRQIVKTTKARSGWGWLKICRVADIEREQRLVIRFTLLKVHARVVTNQDSDDESSA